MTNLVSKISVALAAVCAVLLFSTGAGAQRYRAPRERGHTKAEVDRVIRRVETRSDAFMRLFDKSLDRSRLDGTRREDNLNESARNLERSLDELRREFDRRDRYAETRPEVARALNIAENINVALRRRRLGGETERQWALLRAELNELARVYNLPRLR